MEYSKGEESIQFMWSPPFSHNITDVEPDISHYLVNIINMEDHSVLTVNTTDTEYLLQSQDCHLTHYQVEIAAVNVVGVGDKYTSPSLVLHGIKIVLLTRFFKNLLFFLTVINFSDRVIIFLGSSSPVISFQVLIANGKETKLFLF